MKDKLWIAAGVLGALSLGACEARVNTNNNGQTNSVVISTDNAAQRVEDTVRSADNMARETGDAIENRFNATVNTVRNIDVDVDVRDRRDGNNAAPR